MAEAKGLRRHLHTLYLDRSVLLVLAEVPVIPDLMDEGAPYVHFGSNKLLVEDFIGFKHLTLVTVQTTWIFD